MKDDARRLTGDRSPAAVDLLARALRRACKARDADIVLGVAECSAGERVPDDAWLPDTDLHHRPKTTLGYIHAKMVVACFCAHPFMFRGELREENASSFHARPARSVLSVHGGNVEVGVCRRCGSCADTPPQSRMGFVRAPLDPSPSLSLCRSDLWFRPWSRQRVAAPGSLACFS